MRLTISQPAFVRSSIVVAMSLALMGSVSAAPVPVVFSPPDIAPQALCTLQPEIAAVAAKWEAWDRAELLGSDPEAMLTETQRLRDFDAARFKDVVNAGFAVLAKVPDESFQQKLLVDQIRYAIAAGDAAQVKAGGWIEKLEAGLSTLTPRSLFALAEIYLDGKIAPVDAVRGQAYLLSAAAGGSPDALLRAAQMRANGELPQYSLDPQSAVTVAFGAILGEVDADICSRISRIARYYESGEIVAQNYGLAEKWLRLAADLGDPTAAWKVARYHLTSDRIVKDNDTLIKYLTQAADAQITQAQVELGEIYQSGSLLPLDLDMAETLFRAAANGGYQIGNLRLVTLLESRLAEPEVLARLETALRDLTALPDAPASALVKLSDLIIKKDGRWAGRDEVRPLLERAVTAKSPEAALMLADIVLTQDRKVETIDRAISLLNMAVSEGGKSEAMSRLSDVYMCMVPNAPNLELAAHWRASAAATGNGTPSGSASTDATSDTDLAQAQTMALRGASGPMANYVDMLLKADYGSEVLSFWENRIKQDPNAQNALAKLLVESDPTADGVQLSVSLLESAVAAGSDSARLTLANLLLAQFDQDPAVKEKATGLLVEAASNGAGAAIQRLLDLQPPTEAAAILQRYAPATDERGDLDALLLASKTAANPNDKLTFLTRAVAATDCNFTDVIKLARAYSSSGDKASAEQWLSIATHLTESKGWQYAALAQEFSLLKDNRHAALVVELLENAVQYGQVSSLDRLIELRSNAQSPLYDPQKVVALVQQAVTTANPTQLLNLARRIERTRPDLRDQITKAVDIQAIYRTSAEGGNPTAMRELGRYLQQRATGPQQLTEAMDWIEKAATKQDPEAMLLLAKAYTVGIGRDASLDRALALLEDAAKLGSADAKKMLSAMGVLQTQ